MDSWCTFPNSSNTFLVGCQNELKIVWPERLGHLKILQVKFIIYKISRPQPPFITVSSIQNFFPLLIIPIIFS